METKIKWNEGDGYITATYEGSGSGSASISSDVNEGIDREQSITVETTNGSVSATLVVTQEGLREVFLPSDDDFILADGGTFNTLKILPNGYVVLEYIESTGAQYIDTGFKHNQDTRVVMDVQPTSITRNAWAFEGRDSTSSGMHGVFFYYSSLKLWCADYYASSNRMPFSDIAATDRLYIDYNRNVCTINGASVTHSTSSFQSSYNLTLLACNTGNSISGSLSARLYSCQIYDNGTLVRDYIPCSREDGATGLYDTVGKSFYELITI